MSSPLKNEPPTREPEFLNRDEAAAYLGGIKPQTLACWATSKKYGLPMVKIGRSVRYRKSDLDAFLASRTIGEAVEV